MLNTFMQKMLCLLPPGRKQYAPVPASFCPPTVQEINLPTEDLGIQMHERMLSARDRINEVRRQQAWHTAARTLTEFLRLLPQAADHGFGKLAALKWCSYELTESGDVVLKDAAAMVYRWLQLAGLNPSVELRPHRNSAELKNCVVVAHWETTFDPTDPAVPDLDETVRRSNTPIIVLMPLIINVEIANRPEVIEVGKNQPMESVEPSAGLIEIDNQTDTPARHNSDAGR
jgi:hypothetical protein